MTVDFLVIYELLEPDIPSRIEALFPREEYWPVSRGQLPPSLIDNPAKAVSSPHGWCIAALGAGAAPIFPVAGGPAPSSSSSSSQRYRAGTRQWPWTVLYVNSFSNVMFHLAS
jgi:hypothetical protein